MRIFHQNEILEPLFTKYVGDNDLAFKTRKITSQDGFYFHDEHYLKNVKDQSINNYSNFILTNNIKNDDVFELKNIKYNSPVTFCSSIKFSNEKYLKINVATQKPEFDSKNDRYTSFEIFLLSENLCQIYFVDGFDIYYLSYESGNFTFSKKYNFGNSIFQYIKNKNVFYFQKKISNNLKTLSIINDQFVFSDDIYSSNPATLNFYLQDFNFNANTSWASYEKINKNKLSVNPENSILDCSNNILIYNNYTYISGSEIEANFLTLKNQHSVKNYSYRADNLNNTNPNIPNIELRNYNSLDTGLNQELGFDSIVLSYDTYNSDYIFKADRYTQFQMPDSSYPFEQLNINDSLLFRNGAIAGDTPYHSDKVFFKDIRTGISNAKYLCTWLSGDERRAVWVDRYYYPEKTPFASALSTTSDLVFLDKIEEYLNTTLAPSAYYDNFIWQTSIGEEIDSTPQKIKDAIWGEVFFDKISDVILAPNQEYVYHRLGEKYADQILNALSASLLSDGLLPIRRYDGFEFIFDQASGDITYEFTGNEYSLIDNYRKINNTNEFTLAFSMNSNNWESGFGHEIMGSFNDRGFGVFSDERITPFIMVQDSKENYIYNTSFQEGRTVDIYNTSFQKIDSVYLSQDELNVQALSSQTNNDNIAVTTTVYITSFLVKDLIRTDHLNFFSPTIRNYNNVTTYRNDAIINRRECGILYTNEDEISRILSPNNVFGFDNTEITKIQIEQCKFKTRKSK